ncbi:hypothetical protein GCM10008107_23100 [Psychrosphaera saromensis]|uniref:Uncharacterized protein n=1 Tax=Psychrosphaera saromensis TaxID=716813 RepID=A0A2S7USU5_9GAMM|nr:hypothetical protein [Psychrosphaera saromensis]PQJ52351.1 hypothetical protein BTO11_00915 [Psychrosphaera saromensis]GHB73060.1 hypothetical protein GCM10008107_23100 [Psychrosphaera saromensis]GLQ13487.1 hypothetical protein GCM10007917_09420 [Psychrosphaera saromensis]
MQVGEQTENRFFSLLGEALRLLYEAERTEETFLQNCLVTSSILTITYSLEAAANCILEALEEPVNERQYDTLKKFELVLNKNTGKSLDKSCKEYQGIKNLIKLRNDSVHPKVSSKKIQYKSQKLEGELSWLHKSIEKKKLKKQNVQNMTYERGRWSISEAELAINAVVDFLNIYVCDWWELDQDYRDYIFLPLTNIAYNDDPRMYDCDTLRMLEIFKDRIQLKIVNLPSLPSSLSNF